MQFDMIKEKHLNRYHESPMYTTGSPGENVDTVTAGARGKM